MKFTRRNIGGLALGGFWATVACPAFGQEADLNKALGISDADIELLAQSSGQEEIKQLISEGVEVAGLSDRVKSDRQIAPEAVSLIVASEVTSKAAYTKKYTGVIWPRNASGPTIGIGYDLGYVTRNNFREDWSGYVDKATIDQLSFLCGVTGSNSKTEIAKLKQMPSIDYDTAYRQCVKEVLPRYTDELENTLKNCDRLSGKQLGALVSLSYNRGFSYRISSAKDKSGRYVEMRNIAKHMADGNFAKIPDELKSMRRLWANDSNVRGVALRRKIEAELFASG
jgi:GH24 family phage-related lysozyme (muramidase)